jgi:hypothetical protein
MLNIDYLASLFNGIPHRSEDLMLLIAASIFLKDEKSHGDSLLHSKRRSHDLFKKNSRKSEREFSSNTESLSKNHTIQMRLFRAPPIPFCLE